MGTTVPVTALRIDDATYQIESEPLYPGGRVPRSERSKVVGEMIDAYAHYLEGCCRRAPYQWFNFFDFWESSEERSRRSAG